VSNRIEKLFAELEQNTSLQWLLLGIITLLATILRFYKLGEWSFWGDEFITVRRALANLDAGSIVTPISLRATGNALSIWGTSEWTARLVAAIAGVISVPVLYFPVKKMFDPAVALIASLFLAVSPWHIYWSQNARFYTLLLLMYSLAMLLFYFGFEQDRPWYLIFAMGFLALAIQERLFAAFLVPVIGGYIVLLKFLSFAEPRGLRVRNLMLLIVPGSIGAAIYALSGAKELDPEAWSVAFGFVNNNPLWIVGGVAFYIGIPMIAIGAMSAIHLLAQKNRAALLLSLAAVVPLLSILIVSLFQYAANRYVFVSLTSIIILASVAVKELLWRVPRNSKILASGMLLILFLAPMGENVLYYRYQNGNRDNWKDTKGKYGSGDNNPSRTSGLLSAREDEEHDERGYRQHQRKSAAKLVYH
jgi:4-amino-4-deoxy-L-arabinose transferase-like glycosyltransferase